MTATRDDPMWGSLTVDRDALMDRLGAATQAVYAASQAAMFRTEAGYPISSPMAMILGGLSQVIDGLIDELEATPPSVSGADNGDNQ